MLSTPKSACWVLPSKRPRRLAAARYFLSARHSTSTLLPLPPACFLSARHSTNARAGCRFLGRQVHQQTPRPPPRGSWVSLAWDLEPVRLTGLLSGKFPSKPRLAGRGLARVPRAHHLPRPRLRASRLAVFLARYSAPRLAGFLGGKSPSKPPSRGSWVSLAHVPRAHHLPRPRLRASRLAVFLARKLLCKCAVCALVIWFVVLIISATCLLKTSQLNRNFLDSFTLKYFAAAPSNAFLECETLNKCAGGLSFSWAASPPTNSRLAVSPS
jgi:hypothetical protein